MGPICLVAGMAIGASVLGLPLELRSSGYVPALFGTSLVYLCTLASGILLARLFISHHDQDLPGLFSRHLGKIGATVFNVSYFTLAFCLLVAYWSYLNGVFGKTTLVMIVIAILFYYGLRDKFEFLEKLNATLTVCLIISFIVLVISSFYGDGLPLLKFSNWKKLPMALPMVLCSFGYHQVVPIVCQRLNYNIKSITTALTIGAFIPLVFNVSILTVAFRMFSADELARAAENGIPLFSLMTERVQSTTLANAGKLFGFFAVATSALGVSMAMKGALRDIFATKKFALQAAEVLILTPMIPAMVKPKLFTTVLGIAGGIFGNLIAGLLPVAPFLKRERFRLRYLLLCGVFALIFAMECAKLLGYA
jgi:tyrosine-specific transport protein